MQTNTQQLISCIETCNPILDGDQYGIASDQVTIPGEVWRAVKHLVAAAKEAIHNIRKGTWKQRVRGIWMCDDYWVLVNEHGCFEYGNGKGPVGGGEHCFADARAAADLDRLNGLVNFDKIMEQQLLWDPTPMTDAWLRDMCRDVRRNPDTDDDEYFFDLPVSSSLAIVAYEQEWQAWLVTRNDHNEADYMMLRDELQTRGELRDLCRVLRIIFPERK